MILDRYILRQFLATFFFTLAALSVLFVIIDLFERLDTFMDKGLGMDKAALYYAGYLPFILKLLIPVATLLACLFGVGRLSSFNETTAMRASGQSFLRFLAPYVFIAITISVGQVYFNGWVVPTATSMKYDIERNELHETTGSSLFNLSFRDSPTRNVHIEYYDKEAHTARNVSVEEFGSTDHPRLQWRIDAQEMHWDTTMNHWATDSALKRSFAGKNIEFEYLLDTTIPFEIQHHQIIRLQQDPGELTFDEIGDYIATLQAGGKDTRRQEIEYYAGWAFPWSNVVVVLIAVPFASVRRRGGIAVNIAAAMLLAFGYIAFTEVSLAVGSSTDWSPQVVGWSANACFLVIALFNLILMRR